MIGLRLRSRASLDVHRLLRLAEGFRVDGPRGPLGVVERVLLGADGSAPDSLVVRGRRLRRRRVTIAARDVVDVLPGARRVLVGTAPPRWRTWPPG